MPGFDMTDYVDVAQRISEFAAKYPDGSLQSELKPLERDGVLVGWFCRAYAYRSPDDVRPGIGHAVEPVPGRTPYTKDSEAMNAETSAWGRAIIALGFRTKKVASANEVQARQEPASGSAGPAKRTRKPEAKRAASGSAAGELERDNEDSGLATEEQRQALYKLAENLGVGGDRFREILQYVTGQQLGIGITAAKYQDVVNAVKSEGVPFA